MDSPKKVHFKFDVEYFALCVVLYLIYPTFFVILYQSFFHSDLGVLLGKIS